MSNMDITCYFTGHRPQKLPWGFHESDPRCIALKNNLKKAISGIDCPVCVDNKESIGSFGEAIMPSQVIMLQFIKGRELSVNFKNAMEDQPLRKAS